MEYFVLIIIYLTLYFREDLSKMEYLVLIIIYLTLKREQRQMNLSVEGFQVRISLVCIPWGLPTHVGCDVDYTDGQ
jgi:hypothetical protein